MAVPLTHGLDLKRPLLALLAQSEPRSGTWLARALNTTELEIVTGIEQLRALGIDIAVSPQGFRLEVGTRLELLDADAIRAALGKESAGRLRRLEVVFEVDSTNSRLLAQPSPPAGFADAALAELQYAGRGRQQRRWVSPFGASLALSVGWTLLRATHDVSSLSLAVGVAVSRALSGLGARGILLKWPNDVWFEDRKIGGVLVETKSCGGTAHVVVGVGLNLYLSEASKQRIASDGLAALDETCPSPIGRNALAAALLDQLLSMLPLFERHGFGAFRDEWRSLDALRGRPARVLLAQGAVEGIACGVDEDGGLLLEKGGHLDKFMSGEASLRLLAGEA
ncbi:MAG: biotin--[acetyl-CoA-carboxylase] ligase [Steroidobacteraceae bacterium]|jgi:BirA family biotin operon repressor/biotin-[acetyl-CoA-carboxylase] ligase